jgi:hypothetical protein
MGHRNVELGCLELISEDVGDGPRRVAGAVALNNKRLLHSQPSIRSI